MAEETTKRSEIHFKLSDSRAVWRTPDNTINLSRFAGTVHGTIAPTDELNYRRVQVAINDGILIDTKKAMKNKVDAKEELIIKIDEIKNPYLIAAMIEQESRGRNISRRRREDVVKKLKERLEAMTKDKKTGTSMFQYLEETTETYKIKPDSSQAEAAQDF